MNALCIVAHPDDCVIFAYSYINAHPELKWTICYLTYCEWEPRAQEFKQFWERRNINIIFLGYTDDYRDIENKRISFNQEQARREIGNIVMNYDLILTHDAEGDYGHIHHVFVNQATEHHPRRITFAGPGKGTVKYSIEPGTYSLDELPLHRDVIAEFHINKHSNEYTI
jgi:LmbE family N-acetylglucosaminyl deacetylase